jgi:lipoyl(octanoyl) transferase
MRHPRLPGARQMAIDEALFHLADADSRPLLRFYSWLPASLSLGYFQNYKRVVNRQFCVHNKIDVVRRITGGRSVLHQYEVTYAVVAPLNKGFANQSLQETYQLIAKALNRALEKFGVTEPAISFDSPPDALRESRLPQCFVSVSQYEHSSRSRKIIGSAQKRTRDRFLQHGSILLDFDPVSQSGVINDPDSEIKKKIAPLNLIVKRALEFEEVSEQFSASFEEVFNIKLEADRLTCAEEELAGNLEQKYRSSDWTEGKCR